MEQVKWFNRDFNFASDQNIFPSIMERLIGTPVRLEEKFKYIPPDILTRKIEGTWTIKENVGHLTDLEPLWQGRLSDIISGKENYDQLIYKTRKQHWPITMLYRSKHYLPTLN